MKRIKIIVQYVGTNYAGWQVQPGQKTIQGELEKAIKQGLHETCKVEGSGRTDSGVHAFGQVAHFDTKTDIEGTKICYILNNYLPDDIRVLESCEVEKTFHSRLNAKKKTYQYNFYVSKIKLPLFDQTYAQVPYGFDILRPQSVLNVKHLLYS